MTSSSKWGQEEAHIRENEQDKFTSSRKKAVSSPDNEGNQRLERTELVSSRVKVGIKGNTVVWVSNSRSINEEESRQHAMIEVGLTYDWNDLI